MALTKAIKDADAAPSQVDLAVPFGYGSKEFDDSERAGWRKALGDRLASIPALATHGAVGINGAGNGAIDFASAVLATHNNAVPPSTNAKDDGDVFQFVPGDPTDARINVAVTVGHAMYGGQCGALVIRRFAE